MQTAPSVVEVRGELDLSTVARWEEDVEAVGREASVVVLDLSQVGFVDSAGVRSLFHLVREARRQGTRLLFVAPPEGQVRRLLEILDLEALTPVCDSRADAVRASQRPGEPGLRRAS